MLKRLTIQDIKRIEFEILVYFDKYCKENNLRYFLAYGSLLGAIRHKGFIPWDDDIDIMMPRKDYEKMLTSFPKEQRYVLLDYTINKKYNLPLTKLCDSRTIIHQKYDYYENVNLGVYIDIFVIDSFNNIAEKKMSRIYKKAQRLRRDWKKAVSRYSSKSIISLCKRIITLPYKILGYGFFIRKYDSFCKKWSSNNSCKSGVLLFGENYNKELFDTDFFNHQTFVEFEGHLFPAPLDYKLYLKKMYGNYNELPPVEERKTHGFEAYLDE